MTDRLQPSYLWPIVVGMGLVTFGLRVSIILAWGRFELPPFVNEALPYVPPAVLSAIIFPELVAPGQALIGHIVNVRLIAGAVAALVAWRTRNVVLTLIVGMGVLWLLQALAQ